MPNPLEVENRYAELINSFSPSQSFKSQWIRIHDFFRVIEGNFRNYDTYCLQLIHHFPVFRDPISVAGSDPEVFVSLNSILGQIQEEIPEVRQDEQFNEAHRSLKCVVIFLYFCLGDIDKGIQSIFSDTNPVLVDIKDNSQDLLDTYIDRYKVAKNKKVVDCLEQIRDWWNKISYTKGHALYVPVVETGNSSEIGGRLRKLSAKVIGENSNKDQYENYYAVVGAEKGEREQNTNIVQAVRPLINQVYPDLSNKFFHIQFAYQLSLGFQEGRSSELASGILAFCSITEFSGRRKSFDPQFGLAVTGLLEDEGAVEKVDRDSIPLKTEAAFFSWVRYLVVPESQKHLFKDHSDRLKDKYPNRELQIIGLAHFEDFVYDRRIVHREIESRPRYYAKKAWDNKFGVAGISVIIVLLVIIGRLLYGPLDKNPVVGEYRDSQLNLYNESGGFLKTFDSGFRNKKRELWHSTGGINPQVQFHDLNGDGTNEVFWTESSNRFSKEVNSIKAWSASGDSLIWTFPLVFDINFPKKNSIVDNEYRLVEFHLMKLKDRDIIVATADLSAMFPSIIFTLNAENGSIIQKYVHPGHFIDTILYDITGDGISEIIATGVNNAYWKAAITVLDVTNLKGHGPTKGDYVIEGFSKASELEYLLVPKTLLGKYYDSVDKYNMGQRIRIVDDGNLFLIGIRDAKSRDFPNAGIPKILGYFNHKFQATGFGTNDQYDILARDLHQEGKIPFIPDYEYFEAFKDSLLYWDGEEFVRGRDGISKND